MCIGPSHIRLGWLPVVTNEAASSVFAETSKSAILHHQVYLLTLKKVSPGRMLQFKWGLFCPYTPIHGTCLQQKTEHLPVNLTELEDFCRTKRRCVDKPSVGILSISRSVQPTEERHTCLPYLHTGEQDPLVHHKYSTTNCSLKRSHVLIAALLSRHEHHLRCGLRSFCTKTLVLPIYTHVLTGECGVTNVHSPSLAHLTPTCTRHLPSMSRPSEHFIFQGSFVRRGPNRHRMLSHRAWLAAEQYLGVYHIRWFMVEYIII